MPCRIGITTDPQVRKAGSPPNAPDVRTVLEGSNGPVAGGIGPSTGSGCLPGAPLRCTGLKSFVARWDRHSARRVDQDALLAPSFAPVGVRLLWRPPKTSLAHGAVRRLPFPVHSAQFFAALALQHSQLHPALEGPVDVLSSPSSRGRRFHWQPLRIGCRPASAWGRRVCAPYSWVGPGG